MGSIKNKMTECDKMLAVKDKSHAIGEFLEWLSDVKNYYIGERGHYDTCAYMKDIEAQEGDCNCVRPLVIAGFSTEELLAEYFDINLQKAEREKQQLLATIRVQNEINNPS